MFKNVIFAVSLSFVGAASAAPVELITNGNFESGTLTGWSQLNSGSGSFYVGNVGSNTPVSNHSTLGNSNGGTYYAVTDQSGPGVHALSQSFTVTPGAQSVILSYDFFANNYGGTTINNGGLNTDSVNEFARIDLLSSNASAFDTGAGVLDNLYIGSTSFSNAGPFLSQSFDITNFVSAGGTFQIRFAEADNQGYFNLGVDNVSVVETAAVPEPGSVALLGLGLIGFAASRRKSSKSKNA